MLVEPTKHVIVYYENIPFRVNNIEETEILTRPLFEIYDEGKEEWIILKDFYVWSHRVKKVIKVAQWSITDFASIPKPLRAFISINGNHRYACAVHDLLYRIDHGFGRKTVDKIMRDIAKSQKTNPIKSYILYWGARLGGWPFYLNTTRPQYVPEKNRLKYKVSHPEIFV